VLSGRLVYAVHAPIDESFLLEPGTPGIVAPEIPHEVFAADDEVEFFVEFLRVERS
jgi:hypothetical protein